MNDRQHPTDTIDIIAFCAATGRLFLGMYTPRAAWLQCDQPERPPGRPGNSTVNNCAALECLMYALAQSRAPGAPCTICGMAMYGSELRKHEHANRL
ncbi:MAG: hypothetical protein GWN58_07395, partial [Anaerolineae bacterium]|nr:hypothetical protein [Anaerolineae bacterium]